MSQATTPPKNKGGKPKGLPKSGGRKPGSVNRITADIMHTLAQLKCDPIRGMARIANNKKNEVGIRLHAYGRLAEYIYARRRAVEITPGKTDPSGAELVPLDVLIREFRELRAASKKASLKGKG